MKRILVHPPILRTSDHSILYYDPEKYLLIWILKDIVTVEEFVKTAEAGYAFIAQKAKEGIILGWLNDVSEFKGLDDSRGVLFLRDIINKPLQELMKETETYFKVGFLKCPSEIGSWAVNTYQIFTNAENQGKNKALEIGTFENESQANDWFRQPKDVIIRQPKKVRLWDKLFTSFHLSH